MTRLGNISAHPAWARARVPILAVVLVVVGMVIGARLAGPLDRQTSLGVVSFEIEPSISGEAEIYVPLADWGFRADAFAGPFRLAAELRSLDRPALLSVASGDRELIDRAAGELRDGAELAALRSALWGLGVTAALALAVAFGSASMRAGRGRFLALVGGLAVIGCLVAGARAATSFDVDAFDNPTYYARGSELAQILAAADREQTRGGYSTSVERSLRSFSSYLTGGSEAVSGGRSVILASDIHNNSLVLGPLRSFADGQPVVLAGDFGNDGNETEAELLAPKIAALGDDVVAVSGNHDSIGLMETLAGAGVEVLTEDGPLASDPGDEPLVDIDGLSFAGRADPLQWEGGDPSNPERIFSFSEMPGDGEAEEAAAYEAVVAWFEGLPEAPDVVVIHQNGIAQHLARELWAAGYTDPLTVLTGHDHRQHVDRYGSIVVVDGGTVGAGGIFGAGGEFAGLAQLHFDPQEPILRSVDLIRSEPLSGRAEAERVVIDSMCEQPGATPELEDGEAELCSYEPGQSGELAAPGP